MNPSIHKMIQMGILNYWYWTNFFSTRKIVYLMIRVAKPFMDLVLWPEYNKYASILHKLIEEISIDLISKIHLVKEEDETIIGGELPVMSEALVL